MVDAHRARYAAAVAIQAAVMAKAARALIALHEELHDDVRMDAGNDYGDWHPVGFGGDGLGKGPNLDAVVALSVRIAADAVEEGRRHRCRALLLLKPEAEAEAEADEADEADAEAEAEADAEADDEEED